MGFLMNIIKIINYSLGFLFIGLAMTSYYLVNIEIININIYTLIVTISIGLAIFFLEFGRSIKIESEIESTINKLSKIPNLEKMVKQAKTEEEKIKILEKEKENLLEYIEIESRRMFLKKRLEDLDEKLVESYKILTPTLNEINLMENELENINDTYSTSISLKEIEKVRQKIEDKHGKNIIRFGQMEFEIPSTFYKLINMYADVMRKIIFP